MTTFEAGRPISVDQRKVQTREKLTEIFGSFAEFSDRIAKKNICGLYPMTASPRRPVVSPPQVSHTLPTITVTNGTASSTSVSSSSSSHHSSAKEKDSSMMTTEELLQSMQSLVKAKEPIGVLSKPRDACSSTSSASSASSVSSSSASSSVASSSRVQPSTSSVAPSHRSSNGINGSLSSTSSSSRRDRDKERDRERERDHDSRDFRDSKDRRRDLERERRPAKSHRTTEDRPRQRDRDDHRCSNVATTSSAISGRSSKEREEAAETSAPLKAIDSLFSTSSSKRSFRESPHDDLFGDHENVKDSKRKKKRLADEGKSWKDQSTSDNVQSPDSGISVERGDSDDVADNEDVPLPPHRVQKDDYGVFDTPLDAIFSMMGNLLPPNTEPIEPLPYKNLEDLRRCLKPRPPVLQPQKPLASQSKSRDSATSPRSPPKRPLAAVSPMRPLQNQGNLATPSPHRSKTKISLNLSVLPVDAIKRLKREHAKDLSGRKSHASPPELERAPSSQSSKRSSDGKSSTTQKISPSWSPKRNTSPYRKRSRSPRLEPLAKKRKTPPKTSSNRLEVPQPSSKPGSRLDTRTPSPLNSATAQLRKIFGKRCCAPQTCPRTSMLPAIANIPAERSAATAFILELAREKKHAADKENKNKMKKFFNYLETIIYYIYANSHEDDPVALFNNCCQTLNFTKQIQKQATRNSLNSDYDRHFFSRFQVLIRRCQSCLAFVLFDALQDSTNKRNDMIQKLDSRFRPNISSDLTSMTSLKTYADVNETITVNKNLYILQMQQMKVFTHLYYAHRIWKDNDVSMSPLERGMVEEMDRVCGKLYIHAPLPLVTEWMFTALTWLRDEYSEGSCQPA